MWPDSRTPRLKRATRPMLPKSKRFRSWCRRRKIYEKFQPTRRNEKWQKNSKLRNLLDNSKAFSIRIVSWTRNFARLPQLRTESKSSTSSATCLTTDVISLSISRCRKPRSYRRCKTHRQLILLWVGCTKMLLENLKLRLMSYSVIWLPCSALLT